MCVQNYRLVITSVRAGRLFPSGRKSDRTTLHFRFVGPERRKFDMISGKPERKRLFPAGNSRNRNRNEKRCRIRLNRTGTGSGSHTSYCTWYGHLSSFILFLPTLIFEYFSFLVYDFDQRPECLVCFFKAFESLAHRGVGRVTPP